VGAGSIPSLQLRGQGTPLALSCESTPPLVVFGNAAIRCAGDGVSWIEEAAGSPRRGDHRTGRSETTSISLGKNAMKCCRQSLEAGSSGGNRCWQAGAATVALVMALVASTWSFSAEEPRRSAAPSVPEIGGGPTSTSVMQQQRPTPSPGEVFQALWRLHGRLADLRKAETVGVDSGLAPGASGVSSRPEARVAPPRLTPQDLDRAIAAYLNQTAPEVEPAPLTSDVEFVRRVYLDLAGVPPTPAAVRAFVRDPSSNKRAELIDRLLESPGFAQNFARYWKDVIRFHATNPNPVQVRYDRLEDWLAEEFERNEPWDRIVTRLITATGRVDENGAVGFALAHESKPAELAGEVSRIFLGIQIQCAQCHDHKTDSWKREQFHEFAAFFAGTRPRPFVRGMPGELPVFGVMAQGRARYAMPDLADPSKQIPVNPRFFLGSASEVRPLPASLGAEERRALAASYVTGQDNPWFARAFVNRVWHLLTGDAFYDPIDDLGPDREPKAPEVLDALSDAWQEGGYDIRWLFRTVMGTEVYQRRIRSVANPAGRTSLAANCPSRLRSDQIFDSLIHALGLPGDQPGVLGGGGATGPARDRPRKAAQEAGLTSVGGITKALGKAARIGGPRLLFNSLFGVDPSIPSDEVVGTIPQALFLMNSPLVQNWTRVRTGTVLGDILATAADDRAAVEQLYLRVLSRPPTDSELQVCRRYLSQVGNRAEAFEDIHWALVNSAEFVTRR
jgi:hypothetical protein